VATLDDAARLALELPEVACAPPKLAQPFLERR
jgi:hypothetical protein